MAGAESRVGGGGTWITLDFCLKIKTKNVQSQFGPKMHPTLGTIMKTTPYFKRDIWPKHTLPIIEIHFDSYLFSSNRHGLCKCRCSQPQTASSLQGCLLTKIGGRTVITINYCGSCSMNRTIISYSEAIRRQIYHDIYIFYANVVITWRYGTVWHVNDDKEN